jgi:hypothetical protein
MIVWAATAAFPCAFRHDRGVTNRIAQGGNTVVPAVLALESLGFHVSKVDGVVRASKGEDEYLAADHVAVLGLLKLTETRTWDWGASDSEIDETLRRFGEDG